MCLGTFTLSFNDKSQQGIIDKDLKKFFCMLVCLCILALDKQCSLFCVLTHCFVFSHAGKRRRQTKDFPGADIIVPQIKAKTARKRVGLVSTGPPVRQHTPILSPDGKAIGQKANTVGAVNRGELWKISARK